MKITHDNQTPQIARGLIKVATDIKPPASGTHGLSYAGFITVNELLYYLPVCRKTLHNYIKAGKIPCVRPGGRKLLFHYDTVVAALLRQQRGGDQ